MNKRWEELWVESKTSGVHPDFGEYDLYSAEKFAELIVRECAEVVNYYHTRNESVTPGQILQHFGVKE